MDKVNGKLTVFFEEPFWVGIFERIEDGKLSVAKVTFGAEPKDYEVQEYIQKCYFSLKFSSVVETVVKDIKRNPKRMQREVKKSFLFEKELQTASIDKSKIAEITINNEVYDIVASNNYVVLSSGIKDLWSDIANAKNLGTIFASPYISADVKYYVVKQLREHGYTVFAYGDSKIDLYMLREADKGFLYIGKRISRSLKNESLSGLVPIYDHSLVILADEDEEVQADIAICKSNSGISGSRLAAAHVHLGEKIGRHIATVFPEKNTSILVLERGGRFFGDGVYMGAGGIFYSMNPKQDDAPVINTERVVIVDSVINTGKSIMRIIDELKNHNPGIDVIIAANVIQNEAVELFKDYLVFATRLSKNSFVGVNQSKQTGKTGPDTADRLFNLTKVSKNSPSSTGGR